jgi:nucleoside-diphosphate-sugar epimerase
MPNNKKILISGSSGFLGSHCVEYFQTQGYNVTGVDVVASKTTSVIADIRDYVNVADANFDLILHFAAEVKGRSNIETNYLNMIENIEIDRQVFKWAITHCNHIIYPSSCAVYPVQHQVSTNYPLKENMIDFNNNVIGVSDHLYGWSKLTAERMLWQIHKETDLKIHILRPFSGYGPGQSTDYPMANLVNMIKTFPDKLEVWGDGTQTRDWVHVNDILNTINWCLVNDMKYHTMNIGTGVATSFIDLIHQIYKIIFNHDCPEIKKLINKPSGMMHRVADVSLQKQFNILPSVSLADGIKTII